MAGLGEESVTLGLLAEAWEISEELYFKFPKLNNAGGYELLSKHFQCCLDQPSSVFEVSITSCSIEQLLSNQITINKLQRHDERV